MTDGGVFDPFSADRPRWYAIAAHRPFLEDLAAGVLDWLGERPPEELSDATILLPNRRAARAFTAALSKLSADKPVLLPQVRPLGDLEEDEPPFTPGALGLDLPPAIPALTRRFELAKMIVEHFDSELRPVQALDLADALGRFLDSCQLEEVKDPGLIAGLVEGDMAEHWQKSAEFLAIGIEKWPGRLAELGLVDPSWRKATLLRRLAELWDREPPSRPVIVAGSTGTVPAAADVLGAVARSPQGCVVLPGLDLELDESVWRQIDAENEQHPQRALKRLLERHGIERSQVRAWHCPLEPVSLQQGMARQRLLNEALRPADATGDWRQAIEDIRARADSGRDPIAEGLKGLSILPLRHEEEAAAAIALMMREALETPGLTCALVTPDQALGRRVQARLQRWGITADASAGQPLNRMPAGTLLELAVRWVERPCHPQTLLGLLKHPLVQIEQSDSDRLIRSLERHGLRTAPHGSFARLRDHLERALEPRDDATEEKRKAAAKHSASLLAFVDHLESIHAIGAEPFADGPHVALDAAARALTVMIEALAGQNAWAGPDGEQAAALLSNLIEGGGALGAVSASDMVEMIQGLLADTVVRTGGASHPSLRILGAIEARLVRADRMILAGLEEGVWPQGAPVDPFLSRPMRSALGLPPPERRIGQSAQDFVQAASAPDVVLVHCERRNGQPAVRSRWLWRLDMLTRGSDSAATPVRITHPDHVIGWTRTLDAPRSDRPDYARRPAPTPPVSIRPREMPVTGVERWVRDPYAVYAERILGLKKLDRPGEPAEAMKRGNAIHAAIEHACALWPGDLPEDFEQQVAGFIDNELRRQGFEDAAMAREVSLSRGAAKWLAGFERRRRARGIEIMVEQKGRLTFDGPAGPFTVTARADRIEIDQHGAAIIDFKTGTVPSQTQVVNGFAPQLPLTGAILAGNGFVRSADPVQLAYVQITGRGDGGKECDVSAPGRSNSLSAAEISAAEFERLKEAVAAYDDEARPYTSWEAPQFMGNFGGNYDHLARVWEWFVVGGDNGATEGE